MAPAMRAIVDTHVFIVWKEKLFDETTGAPTQFGYFVTVDRVTPGASPFPSMDAADAWCAAHAAEQRWRR